MSYINGKLPDALKSALITPLIKNLKLDCEILRNYCPCQLIISREKQLSEHVLPKFKTITNNNLRGEMQSVYRPCYSTETFLLCLYNDLLPAVDKG